MKSYRDETKYSFDKEILKTASNHACLAVIKLDSALKKMETIVCKCFQKNLNTLENN